MQGGRKYMEDFFSISYRKTDDEQDMEYAYFGIFDGHGGREAAVFAKVGFFYCLWYWGDAILSVSIGSFDGFYCQLQ